MNSIRPLITITILAVVGAWLYVKINEGPARPAAHGEPEPWPSEGVDGVPPLAETNLAPPPSVASPLTTAPPATATAPTTTPTTPHAAVAGLPEMPAIPELPDVGSTLDSAPATAAPSNAPPTALPTNIPTAQYPDGAANGEPSTLSTNPADNAAPLNPPGPDTNTIGAAPSASSTPAALAAPSEHEDAAATNSAMARAGLTPQTLPTSSPSAGSDRYGSNAGAAVEQPVRSIADPITPLAESGFAAAWPVIQSALDRGELPRAHQLLSQWYGEESLTPAEAQQVDTLLNQLAGTVVYSTEHQLEPARIVRPGETLDSIAKECQVPWQLLAKINGIPSADAVQPGQQLKVVRGPFSAVVDLSRSQLTLMLDGGYAGRFPITVPSGATVSEGQWLVDQKLAVPSGSITQTSYATVSSAVDRAIVLRSEEAATGKPDAGGPTLTIASGTTPAGPTATPPAIRLSPQDAEELSDILSVGSRVVIQR